MEISLIYSQNTTRYYKLAVILTSSNLCKPTACYRLVDAHGVERCDLLFGLDVIDRQHQIAHCDRQQARAGRNWWFNVSTANLTTAFEAQFQLPYKSTKHRT